MALDVYRSCSWAEKRRVLDVFWRRGVVGSERITTAAVQYGPWAAICCAVVVLELGVVLGACVRQGSSLVWLAALGEAVAVASTWWAAVRTSVLRRVLAASYT